MDTALLDLKFYRIINGYFEIQVNNQIYKVVYPDTKAKYRAQQLYVSLLADSRFDTEYLNASQLNRILIYNEIWSDEEEEKLNKINPEIDNTKIKLYLSYKDESLRSGFQQQLSLLRKFYNELYTLKHSLDHLTLDFFATNVKNQFLVAQSIYTLDNQPVFGQDYYGMDLTLLKQIIEEIKKHEISAEELRLICMGDTWRRYACQKDIFGPTINLNDDQINLLTLHQMYQNVRQHPECPSEEVISDPDALDGWFLHQKNEYEKTKKKNKALEKVRGKVKNSDFVYIVADNDEEAAAIRDLNDQVGKNLMKSIDSSLKKNDGKMIQWSDVGQIKQDIKNQAFEKFRNKRTS